MDINVIMDMDMNIAENLQTLIDVKEDIKNAIEEKGVTISGGLDSYADAIDQIEGGGIFYVPDGMKFGASSFSSFPKNWNTSNVTDMDGMFKGCTYPASLDLIHFDTSNARSMYEMFDGCVSLTSLDLSGWDTSNVTDISYMFSSCAALTSLDLSGWDTSNVTDMSYMLELCDKLTSLNISNFDFSKVTNIDHFLPYNYGTIIDLKFGKNLKIDWIGIGAPYEHPTLSKESLLSIIDGLYDFVGNGKTTTRKCRFGSTNLKKLTDEQKAVATNKGWTLS